MNENKKTIKAICEEYKISQAGLARLFGIPIRTVEDWYAERRIPPDYVVTMISELITYKLLKANK